MGFVKASWRVRAGEEDLDVNQILLDLGDMETALKDVFGPLYEEEFADVYHASLDELDDGSGVPVFSLDTPEIQDALDAREEVLVGSAPETIQNNLRESIREGIDNGETIQELRDRVAEEMNISAAESKALMVARTESAGFMNDVREAMFEAQGFDDREWTTAGDEHVRPDHVKFGEVGPVKKGHNYMEDVGKTGKLEYPGDTHGPAGEVINCRCVHVPA